MDISRLYEYYIVLYYVFNYNDIALLNERDYDLNEVYNYVNQFYYNNFGTILNVEDDENKRKLFEFLNEIFKYNLLKNNIEDVYDELNNYSEKYIINNLEIVNEITEKTYNQTDKYKLFNMSNLSKLSSKDLDNYFKMFLLSIDDSLEYLNIYNYIKENNRIIYLDLLNETLRNKLKSNLNINDSKYNDFFFRSEKFGGFIVLDRSETIEDFSKLAHEFTHFVTFKNNKNTDNLLLEEFPAIFYEVLSNIFLINNGFNKEIVRQVIFDRNKYIHDISTYLLGVNLFLDIYLNNNENIDKKIIEKYILTKDNQLNFGIIFELCDYVNYNLTINPKRVVNSYPYIIGNYLSNKYINRYLSGEDILKDIKDITINLPKISPYEIINNDIVKKKEKR